jgi:hypothetical protein
MLGGMSQEQIFGGIRPIVSIAHDLRGITVLDDQFERISSPGFRLEVLRCQTLGPEPVPSLVFRKVSFGIENGAGLGQSPVADETDSGCY